MNKYEPQHEKHIESFDPEWAVDDLYDKHIQTQNAIMGLCVAMIMHVVGTYLIVRRLKRG